VITLNDEVIHFKMLDESPCGRQTYKGNKKCIFHLENKSIEEAKIFEIAFWRELERMQKNENIKELDFTGFIFPNEISFSHYLFEKPVFFIGARFNNITIFFDVQFNNRADFHKVQFNNRADFSFAQFNNEVSFSFAQFNNEVYFSFAQFNNEVSFFYTQFNNKAYFSSEFNNKTYFDYSEFRGVVSFINAKLPYSSEDLISFKSVKFHKPKDVGFQNLDLSNVSFLNTDVTEVEFMDVNWRKNGRLVVADENRIGKDKKVTYGAVAQLYRRLRRNYETNYRFAEAGDFFIGEMEMRRLDVNTNIMNEKIRNIVLWFKRNFSLLCLYKHLSLYGESYVRPMMWAIIVIVSYPMLMYWLFNASLPQSGDFPTYLRTSAASFFQMDNTYIGERLIGFLLLGLLFIALKRQFERKK
jgi:uncharacterized protein YjbI with pentapeptide repeats